MESLFNEEKTILDLCGGTGSWSMPYKDAGYNVIIVDPKVNGQDVRLMIKPTDNIYGILAAPVCTVFAGSGAQYWPKKDVNGETLEGLALVDACLRVVYACRDTLVFWSLENPVGRLRHYLGPPEMMFNPCDYGDPYTKKTLLWGKFNHPVKNPIEPVRVCSQGSWIQKLGGKSERTKMLRSMTSPGFARAFFEANL